MGRDPRWGRIEETFGEDTWLTSRMAVAAVRGLQGGYPGAPGHIIASPKHYAAFGQSAGGRQMAPADIPERMVRDEILPPFKAAVVEAEAGCIMPAYISIDGAPCHGSRKLLTAILREEWGFTGAVISDFGGVAQLHSSHHVAKDGDDAALKALAAGIDADLPSGGWAQALNEKAKTDPTVAALVDRSVRRVLALKFKLGLFENPCPDLRTAKAVIHCDEHLALAREAAEKAVVLLKNDGRVLPLDKEKTGRIAVVGPHGTYLQFGGVSGHNKGVSVVDGLKAYLGDAARVDFERGCGLTDKEEPLPYLPVGFSVKGERPKQVPIEYEREPIAAAAKLAKQADAAIVCIGESSWVTGENFSADKAGDRSSLELIGNQIALLKAVKATGTPTIAALIHGRPLAIHEVLDCADAVLDCWNIGEQRGAALARILFGETCPGGRLPMTVPLSAGHVPCHYSMKRGAYGREYAFDNGKRLLPFGFGLSYTMFAVSGVRTCRTRLKPGDGMSVLAEITNTGAVTGDEVFQVYVRDCVSSVSRPDMELKAFQRVTVKPGETVTVKLGLSPAAFAFTGEEMKTVIEPGEFEILAGTDPEKLTVLKIEIVE